VQRRRFPVSANPTRQPLQPEAIGAVMEVTKWLKPSISVSRIGDSASVQAATRVNAEQSSKRTMRRSTRQPYRGRLIRLNEMSEAISSDAAPGSGGGMYTANKTAAKEAVHRVLPGTTPPRWARDHLLLGHRAMQTHGLKDRRDRRQAKRTEVGCAGSFFSQNFIHCFSLRQLID
jgi:hypothetical protein